MSETVAEHDIIRCDLEGYSVDFIEDALTGFIEGASRHCRRVAEFRMRRAMLDHLKLEGNESGSVYKGVPVFIVDTGFDGTIEVKFVVLVH